MELGLFWLLAEQSLDAPAVAQALGIPANRCQYWLQLLSTTGLIEQGSKGYAPSQTARTAILDAHSQDTWALLAEDARDRLPAIFDLALNIREPGSAWAAQGRTPPDYFAQLLESPDRARRFTRMLYEFHVPLAEELANRLDMSGVERLMDLGGGSGVMSLALLRRYPHLTAVVVDIANVCAAGREIAAENSLGQRITYHVADLNRDELPSGFDLALQCDVGFHGEAFLRKVRTALNPGGRLVIVDQFAPAEGLAPALPPYPHWAFLASLEIPDHKYSTAAEIQALLAQSGYRLLSVKTLPCREGLRWARGWVVIEAGK
jgi:SAM-dependent methyltransferase